MLVEITNFRGSIKELPGPLKENGKENSIVATFAVEYTSSSAIMNGEIAHPSHAGHYHAGHGHGHGHGAGNAGGGIIVAD